MVRLSPVVQILADTDQLRSIQSLAERNQGQYATFHKAAHRLADAGCIRLERHGKEVLAKAASSKIPALAQALLDSRMARNLSSIFRGDRDELLWVLHKTGRVDTTADVMDRSKRTVYSAIQALSSKGILVKKPRYQIHAHHTEFTELLGELDRLRAEHRLHEAAPKARLLWHLGPEMLIQADQAIDEAQTAGLDAFSEYGIDIRTTGAPLQYVGKRALTAADAILQALVAVGYETPNPAMTPEGSVRVGPEFNYACLLWEKEAPRDIWDKSDIYFGKEDPARDVVEYVHEKAEWAGFIPWPEHERLRKLYGIGT